MGYFTSEEECEQFAEQNTCGHRFTLEGDCDSSSGSGNDGSDGSSSNNGSTFTIIYIPSFVSGGNGIPGYYEPLPSFGDGTSLGTGIPGSETEDCLQFDANGNCIESAGGILLPNEFKRRNELREIIESPFITGESEASIEKRTRAVGEYFDLLHPDFKEMFEMLNSTLDEPNLDITDKLFIWQKAKNAYDDLKPFAIDIIDLDDNDSITTIIPVFELSQAEGELLSAAFLPHVKSIIGDNWPQSSEEWEAVGKIMSQFLLEIGLAVIPGSDIIDVVGGLNDGDYIAVSIGIAGLVVDAFGGTILKIIGKVGKVAYKTFKIFKLAIDYLDEIKKTIDYGLKAVLDNNIVKIVNDSDDEIARIYNNNIISNNGLDNSLSMVLKFNYSGFGGDIVTTPNNTTTLIGKWDNQLENIWNSGLAKQGENNGGLNVLGEVLGDNLEEQWLNNKSWLLQAVNRGDIIRVTADPSVADNLIYANNGIVNFNNFDEVVQYMTSFDDLSTQFSNLSFFGKEVHTLINNGHSFNQLKNTFEL